jgi:hypothetical protein
VSCRLLSEVYYFSLFISIVSSWLLGVFCIIDAYRKKRIEFSMDSALYVGFVFALSPIHNSIYFYKNKVFNKSYLNKSCFIFSIIATIVLISLFIFGGKIEQWKMQ